MDAKKNRFDSDAAWALLKDASEIAIAKGKKYQKFTSPQDNKDDILKQAIGPSGNLRAPTYRLKDQFIVGFNAELYEDFFV